MRSVSACLGAALLLLPAALSAVQWRNIFTEELLSSQQVKDGAALDMAAVFANFPFGVLVADVVARPDQVAQLGRRHLRRVGVEVF